MKTVRYIFLILAAVCGFKSVSAAGRADEILKSLAAHVRSLGNYNVAFCVETGGRTTEGSYAVGGEAYYLRMGDAEVYGDGKVRYEVNNRMKEVTIDLVDTRSRNILNNPTQAFDLAGSEFTAVLLWERDGQAAVKLTPKLQGTLSTVTVTVDTWRMEPLSLVYDFDGDSVGIAVRRMSAQKPQPKAFDKSVYAGFEIIDFR